MREIKKVHFLPTIPKIKNVAAYCRVSTPEEIQLHSLKAQQEFFEGKINNTCGWQFAGIYTDHASGRNNKKMVGFQKMMRDCREGKIDFILVKSISRLGQSRTNYKRLIRLFKGGAFLCQRGVQRKRLLCQGGAQA